MHFNYPSTIIKTWKQVQNQFWSLLWRQTDLCTLFKFFSLFAYHKIIVIMLQVNLIFRLFFTTFSSHCLLYAHVFYWQYNFSSSHVIILFKTFVCACMLERAICALTCQAVCVETKRLPVGCLPRDLFDCVFWGRVFWHLSAWRHER